MAATRAAARVVWMAAAATTPARRRFGQGLPFAVLSCACTLWVTFTWMLCAKSEGGRRLALVMYSVLVIGSTSVP